MHNEQGRRFDTPRQRLRASLAAATRTNPEEWFPVFKARYGMEIVFDQLRQHRHRGSGAPAGSSAIGRAGKSSAGSVVTQLFTCCTAIDPILAAGLEPVYTDIDPGTMSIDSSRAEDAISNVSTLAVVLQHTFGIIDDESSQAFAASTRRLNPQALLVEDCAHCVARLARDAGHRPLADVSVHSFGVEKVLPTRFGGALWLNPELGRRDPQLHADLTTALEALPEPNSVLNRVCKAYVAENHVLGRLGPMETAARAWLQKHGLYEPPISESERRGGLAYQPMGMSAWMERKAVAALDSLGANYRLRQRNAELYANGLKECRETGQLSLPRSMETMAAGRMQPVLRFPFLAPDAAAADRIIVAVRRAGVLAERWYRPQLFPGVENPEAYRVPRDRSSLTQGDMVSDRIVCLPTDLPDERVRLAVKTVANAAKPLTASSARDGKNKGKA